MAETRPGARRPGDKRERILRGAVKVFAKKGFYASRVNEIARAAGVADGTIYLYFKSKDEILTSLFEDRIARASSATTSPRGSWPARSSARWTASR